MPAQFFGAQAAVTFLNRAFANTSPSNAAFKNQETNAIASLPAGADPTQASSYTAFAKTFGAAYANQTAAQLSTLLMTNLGLLPNATLETALADYITANGGPANVGIVALQLATLLSSKEGDAVYGTAATAWNNEVNAAATYSTNTANTTPQVGDITTPPVTQGQTYTLTTGVDNITGTANNDTINGVSDNAVATSTFNNLDVIDGGAGTDTMTLTNAAGTMTLPTGLTVKNVESLVLRSAAGAVTGDVQAWTGLTSVAVDQLGTAANITINTKSNATSASFIKGDAVSITDNGSGTGAGKDVLATVSLNGNAGAAAISSDALTALSISNTSQNTTVTATAGTRVLGVTVDKVTGGTISDGEATGLTVAATGNASTGIVLATAKAATISFSGDKTVSLDLGNAAAQAANLVITSSNSAGVTLTNNALDNDVTFTGGAGKDTVSVAATTKTINMGAGDDTVVVTSALGTGGSLNGGDGTDTLSMTAAVAQTLSADTTFSKAFSNFEKVSIGAPAAVTSNTVNLANLNNLSYVISAGTGAAGTNETAAIQFTTLAAGASITIAGRTVTATSGNATATQVATAFSSGTSAGPLTVSGTLASYTAGAVSGGGNDTVTFTSTTQGDVANLAPTFAGVAAPAAPSVSTTNGTGATTETADVTFSDLAIGQSVTVAGRVITATGGAATAAQVAAVAASGTSAGNLTASGTLADWNAGAAAGAVVTFTSTTANTNVTNITVSANGTATPTVTGNTITAGTSGSTLTVSNMANAGTFELTGVVAGEATVSMKDATGSADSLNIKLNGTANVVNTGTLTVSGVETINIEATDSSADTTTLTNPAAASTINLVASAATKIVVTGNHGVNFTGSTLTNVVELDATGVVSVGNAAGASSTQIGTTGAVTFTSAVTNKNVTVSTGNGADVINVSSVTDATKTTTVSTGAGNDTVTGSAGKDAINLGAGNDTVNSSGSVDTITLGDGNDIYVLGSVAHSVVAARDVITDFKANTVGQGAAGAVTTAGATTTAADRNGDVIDINTVNGAFTVIRVGVLGNAADAQTFIQNGAAGAEGANTVNAALDSTTGFLYLDTDDNGVVDSVIELTGVTTINAAAFVLA